MSASSTLPIVAVFGATGAQGGSVVQQIFSTDADAKLAVRAITRNTQSAAAQQLQKKFPKIELVQANANDSESVLKALDGVTYAFFVTSFWDPEQKLSHDTDWKQGKNLVDAAVAKHVKFVVWSSLHDVAAISKGALNVPHFTEKNKVEQYITSVGLPAAFVYAGFYADNWAKFPGFGPIRGADGSVSINLPVRADVGLPVVDIEADFGQFVVPILLNPSKFQGKRIHAATDYVTLGQMAKWYSEVNGEVCKVNRVPYEVIPLEEMRNTMRYFNEYGYYAGEDITQSHALYDAGVLKLHTLRDWIQRTGFKAVAPPSH